MKVLNGAMRGILIGGVVLIALVLDPNSVQGHGALEVPISRSYNCFLEGPENPKSAACKAAVEAGGTQALYDWNEVNIGDANDRHQEIIPDGKLCSAGRDKYRGLDLARDDWPAQTLPQGGDFTFVYKATAAHATKYFRFYVTRDSYDPTQPLKWSDLEPEPFFTSTNPTLQNGQYIMPGSLPSGKTGRHVIYTIWQRSDSPEAFYSCSDVIFGDSGDGTSTGGGDGTSTGGGDGTSTGDSSNPNVVPWQTDTYYAIDNIVSYEGLTYKCLQAHRSQSDWKPPLVPALWELVN